MRLQKPEKHLRCRWCSFKETACITCCSESVGNIKKEAEEETTDCFLQTEASVTCGRFHLKHLQQTRLRFHSPSPTRPAEFLQFYDQQSLCLVLIKNQIYLRLRTVCQTKTKHLFIMSIPVTSFLSHNSPQSNLLRTNHLLVLIRNSQQASCLHRLFNLPFNHQNTTRQLSEHRGKLFISSHCVFTQRRRLFQRSWTEKTSQRGWSLTSC